MPLTAQQFAASLGMLPTAAAMPPRSAAFVYMTRGGDRWDTIAWNYYGDVAMMGALILANLSNPALRAWPQFDAGVEVIVPILAAPAAATDNLPPWRQH